MAKKEDCPWTSRAAAIIALITGVGIGTFFGIWYAGARVLIGLPVGAQALLPVATKVRELKIEKDLKP